MLWKVSLSNLLHAQMSSVFPLFSQECYISARQNSMCSVVTEYCRKVSCNIRTLTMYHRDWRRLGCC